MSCLRVERSRGLSSRVVKIPRMYGEQEKTHTRVNALVGGNRESLYRKVYPQE